LKRLHDPECGVYQEPIGCTLQLDECVAACQRRVQAVASEQRRSGEKYQDTDFPPNARSLFASGQPPHQAPSDAWPSDWQRASEGAFSKARTRNGTETHAASGSHITQEAFVLGPLGCAPLLGALAAARALGKEPKDLIVWREPEAGVYGVRLFKDGEWMYEVLDDFLPLDAAGRPACSFARSSSGEMQDWLALVEKAYAKVHGSYEAAAGSTEAESMEDILGFGASRVDMSEFPIWGELWQHLRGKRNRGYVQLAVRRRERLGEALTSGLISCFAYPLTRLELVDGEMLCELDNPWPHGDWNGRWGQRSPERARAARQLEPQPNSCKPFWMSSQDFCNNFTDVFEARTVSPYWQTASVVCTSERPSYPLVSVSATTQALFVMSQADRRWSEHHKEDYDCAIGMRIYRCRIVAPQAGAVGVRQNVSSPFKNLELLLTKSPTKARSITAEIPRLEANCLYIVAMDTSYNLPYMSLRVLTASAPRFRELSAPEVSYFQQASATCPVAVADGSFSSQGSSAEQRELAHGDGHHERGYHEGGEPVAGDAEWSTTSHQDRLHMPRFVQACIATCGGPLNS
jgi:hypothetical protein